MPYLIDWLDGDHKIASIRMADPFDQADLSGLQADFAPAIATGQPLYLLVDIRRFNALSALALLGGTDGLPLPEISAEQGHYSRLAIVGGSAMVRLLLKMVDEDDSGQIRPFTDEGDAVAWLSEAEQTYRSGAS